MAERSRVSPEEKVDILLLELKNLRRTSSLKHLAFEKDTSGYRVKPDVELPGSVGSDPLVQSLIQHDPSTDPRQPHPVLTLSLHGPPTPLYEVRWPPLAGLTHNATDDTGQNWTNQTAFVLDTNYDTSEKLYASELPFPSNYI